jgi:hypothetical protein
VSSSPGCDRLLRQEDAYRISQLAIGGYVEDEFRSWRFRIIGQRGSLADELILVDVSLSARIGLKPADCHADIIRLEA